MKASFAYLYRGAKASIEMASLCSPHQNAVLSYGILLPALSFLNEVPSITPKASTPSSLFREQSAWACDSSSGFEELFEWDKLLGVFFENGELLGIASSECRPLS